MRLIRYLAGILSLASALSSAVVVVQRPHIPSGGGGNSAPTITVPGAQDTPWLATETFAGTISIADTDDDVQEVGLSVANGTFTLDGTTGLGFSVGDGTNDAAMTFTGSITNINNSLSGMVYTPTAGFAGHSSLAGTFDPDELEISTDDGAGGTDSDSVVINVVSGGEVLEIPGDIGTIFTTTAGMTGAGTGDPVGRAEDQSGRGNNATQVTDAARPTASATVPSELPGANVRSLSFDGTDDFLQVADDTDIHYTNASAKTIATFFRLGRVTGVQSVFSKWGAVGTREYLLYANGSTLTVGVNGESTEVTTTVAADTWYHAALTLATNGGSQLFINGSSVGTGSATSFQINADPLRFGQNTGMNFAQVRETNIRIYGSVITTTQIGYLSAGGP